MSSLFSQMGIPAVDFVEISAFFLLTMLIFFGLRDKKHRWLRYYILIVFVLLCLPYILFGRGLILRIFAALMLLSTLVVEAAVVRRRRIESDAQLSVAGR
jgi:hypothetical protein